MLLAPFTRTDLVVVPTSKCQGSWAGAVVEFPAWIAAEHDKDGESDKSKTWAIWSDFEEVVAVDLFDYLEGDVSGVLNTIGGDVAWHARI